MELAGNLLKNFPRSKRILGNMWPAPSDSSIRHPKTGSLDAIIHLMNAAVGIGVMSLPDAVDNAGYILAIGLGLPLVLLELYTVHILLNIMSSLSIERAVPYTPYEECMYICVSEGPNYLRIFAKPCKYTLKVLLAGYPLGISTAHVVFISIALSKMFPFCTACKLKHLTIIFYCLLLIGPLFALNCIRSLNKMRIISYLAFIITVVAVILLITVMIMDSEDLVYHRLFGNVLEIPLFLASVLFAFEAIGVIIAIEEHMKSPESFRGTFGIFNVGMFLGLSILITVATIGYWRYGSQLRPSIIENLPSTALALTTKILFVIFIYITYPLQCFPMIDFIWFQWLESKITKNTLFFEYLFRLIITLMSVGFAIILPEFETVVRIIGSVCISNLVLFFPALMEYTYLWRRFKRTGGRRPVWAVTKDFIIMSISICLMVSVLSCIFIKKMKKKYRSF